MLDTRWNRYNREWDPWHDIRRLQRDMNRLIGNAPERTPREYPAINVWQGDDDVILTAEIPGVEPDDLDITVEENTVTLRGSRKTDALQDSESYHRQERSNGSFVRSVQLPFSVEADKVEAALDKGILRLTLPRAEADKPKKIEVKTA